MIASSVLISLACCRSKSGAKKTKGAAQLVRVARRREDGRADGRVGREQRGLGELRAREPDARRPPADQQRVRALQVERAAERAPR